DRRNFQLRPLRLAFGRRHPLPRTKRLQAPVEKEVGLVLLRRQKADRVFGKSRRSDVALDVRDESVLVLAVADELACVLAGAHDTGPRAAWDATTGGG